MDPNAAGAELERAAIHVRIRLDRFAVRKGALGAALLAGLPSWAGKKSGFLQATNDRRNRRQGRLGGDAKMPRDGGRDLLLCKSAAIQIPDDFPVALSTLADVRLAQTPAVIARKRQRLLWTLSTAG